MNTNLPKGIFTSEQNNEDLNIEQNNTLIQDEEALISEQVDDIEKYNAKKEIKRFNKTKYKKLEPKQWMLINLIYMIPFANIAESIYFIVTKKHPETENWGRGAVIPSTIISLIMLFIIIRFKFMGFEGYINLYNILH